MTSRVTPPAGPRSAGPEQRAPCSRPVEDPPAVDNGRGGPAMLADPDRRVLSFAQGWRRRVTRSRRRRSHRLMWSVLTAVGLLSVAWVVLASPLLAVRSVQVAGSTAAVRELATDLVGATKGRSIVLVDTSALETRLEADSRVATATVRRGLPTSLVVEVVARVPVLALQRSQGKVELLDLSGTRVEIVATAPAGVPRIRGGDGISDGGGVRAALKVLAVLPDPVRVRVRDLRIDATGSVSFGVRHTAAGATRVVWGDEERGELKARVVQILLSKKPATIDVSAPDTPVTT